MMHQNNSLEWVKFLDDAMKIYLNRTHRTIKMSPLEAEKDENASSLLKTYYKKYMKAEGKKTKTFV